MDLHSGDPCHLYALVCRYNTTLSKVIDCHAPLKTKTVTSQSVSKDQLRRISVFPVLSKVFEKLVAIQMTNYADHAHLLHDRISAFRKGHSTTTALMGVRDDIRYAMKRKEVTLMALADFSKAFDTISFSAIIMKFYKLGFSKPFLKWLLSYLPGRSQFVR